MKDGEEYLTKYGMIRILKYYSYQKISVEFLMTGFKTECQGVQIRKGTLKDPLHPVVYNKGYFGVGCHKANTSKYNCWIDMLRRCYDISSTRYTRYGGRGVTVSDSWLNFQVFGDWFEENYKDGYEVDKDLLSTDKIVYSESTCRFVPKYINNILTFSNKNRGDYPLGVSYNRLTGKYISQVQRGRGISEKLGEFETEEEAFRAYKTAKESYIRLVAKRALSSGQIDGDIYTALVTYEIKEFPD